MKYVRVGDVHVRYAQGQTFGAIAYYLNRYDEDMPSQSSISRIPRLYANTTNGLEILLPDLDAAMYPYDFCYYSGLNVSAFKHEVDTPHALIYTEGAKTHGTALETCTTIDRVACRIVKLHQILAI